MANTSPSVFVRKDMLDLRDSNNGSYNSHTIQIDTSQLANSNKYLDYSQAYMTIPLIMAASETTAVDGALTGKNRVDNCFSLKNWYGSVINTVLLDWAGTTIIQSSNLSGMWKVWQLLTTMSMSNVEVDGPTLGFYPDECWFTFSDAASVSGQGVCNNGVVKAHEAKRGVGSLSGKFGNIGAAKRQEIFFDDVASSPSQVFMTKENSKAAYRSHIHDQTSVTDGKSSIVYAIQAIVKLRHLHSFFRELPLIKGAFFRLTLTLNQPTVDISVTTNGLVTLDSITSPMGGVVPFMITVGNEQSTSAANAVKLPTFVGSTAASSVKVTMNVGNELIDPAAKALFATAPVTSLANYTQIHVPAYTFAPSFESSYLSSPTKTIHYTDLYTYVTKTIPAGQPFNELITNGISAIQSLTMIPILPSIATGKNYPQYMSPFDSCGGAQGCPLAHVTNLQVVMSGQNMFYQNQQYLYQHYLENISGMNSVNGNLVDGLTSGLISQTQWEQMPVYYIDLSRGLPIDEAVPKSLSISGKSLCQKDIQFICFIEYKVAVSLDLLTGARV